MVKSKKGKKLQVPFLELERRLSSGEITDDDLVLDALEEFTGLLYDRDSRKPVVLESKERVEEIFTLVGYVPETGNELIETRRKSYEQLVGSFSRLLSPNEDRNGNKKYNCPGESVDHGPYAKPVFKLAFGQ